MLAQGSNSNTGIIPSATEEVLKLRKEIRVKEADFNKEKALLQQKVDQLEQQIRDFKEREEQQKKVFESMISCLNTNDPNMANQALAQFQAAEKQAQAEIQELQQQKRRLYDDLEYKEKQYQRQLGDKDLFIKDLQHQMDRIALERRQQLFAWDQEKKELQQKMALIQNEKDQVAQKIELKNQCKTNELQMELERLKLEHQREIEKMKSEYESNLKEIKYFHEQEKFNLQTKVERSNNELSSLFHMVKQKGALDQDQSQDSIKRRREELEAEVVALHDEVDQIKKQYDLDLSQLTKDKVAAENKAVKLQKQLEKIKNAPKPIKIDLSQTIENKKQSEQESKTVSNLKEEVEGLVKENERLNEQVKKFRREILESQDYIEKIESNERKLRQALKEKQQSENDSDKLIETKKLLNNEKKRNIELQENIDMLKDQVESLKEKHLSEMLEKDQKIIKLSKEFRETERKLQDIQSVFNSNQLSSVKHNRNLSPFTVTQDLSQIHNRNGSYSPHSNNGMPQFGHQPQHQHHYSQQNFQMSPRSIHQNNHNQSTLICAPMQEGQQIMKQISQLEFTLLKTCQRMADSAIRMECGVCFMTFETADFYDHIISDHPTQNNKTHFQQSSNQSQNSNYQYNTNKHNNAGKRYAEDLRSSSHQHNILSTSPKVHTMAQNTHRQQNQHNMPRWGQNSKSFTCLLNEIEEEEKNVTDTSNNMQQNTSQMTSNMSQITTLQRKSKSPLVQYENDANKTKSRNVIGEQMNQTQMNSIASGNTLQSVLKSQKQLKKQLSNLSTSRVHNPQNTTVMTACRTEIQNLKRQNKKLSNQLQEQESKLNDVSRDCSMIKKQVKKEKPPSTGNSSNNLTNEIKGLLEKLVTYQANSKDSKQDGIGGGGYTSRQNKYLPMSTESLVELRSSASSTYGKRKKQGNTKKHHHKDSKSPIPTGTQKLTTNHHSNKENIHVLEKHIEKPEGKKVPKLNLQIQTNKQAENHNSSSSSNEKIDQSLITTERRYHQVKKSAELCSNSPRRYQNYFEILQSIDETTYNQHQETQKIRRYSPTNEQSQQKLTKNSSSNLIDVQKEGASQSRNFNMPGIYYSKQQQNTVNSSNHNLVLYDSNNTDVFKSKNLKNHYNHYKHNRQNEQKRLNFDQQNSSLDDCCKECEGLNHMPSSCPSLDEYDENLMIRQNDQYNEGIFNSSTDEDPFITGRFCDNDGQGKHFLFKYSGNNSKNATLKANQLNK